MKTYKSCISKLKIIKEHCNFKKVKITTSRDMNTYVRQFWSDDIEIYESMFLILLNRNNNIIAYVKISQGGTIGTVVDIKIIMKYTIDTLANSIILCHNHPSGNLKFSDEDLAITKKVKNVCNMMDVVLLDHIIVTVDEYSSMADQNVL